jgi:hypothetical protein
VVNLDLPWNPAILEQRIGRDHRLGQKRPVQVVNFVSQGTIEQGMLEVLRFKKSLFAGVLDGGEKDISFGGTRLTKFMETVEQTTASIPQPAALDSPTSAPATAEGATDTVLENADVPETPAAQATADNPWAGLLQAGLSLLQQATSPKPEKGASSRPAPAVVRDDKTGSQFLQIPMPKPEVLRDVTDALQKLLKAFTQ